MDEFAVDTEHPLAISADGAQVQGLLHIPSNFKGIVIFAHGSGSGRLSSRNQFIARSLQTEKFATLLFDLLTADEEAIDEKTLQFRFDIDFLADRLVNVTNWVIRNPVLNRYPIGYFGASTGGAAALVAAARLAMLIKAVVSRGGRPDLAGESLEYVEAATLLIVGGNDQPVIEMNEEAFTNLHCIKKIEIIPGATHLFEEPGKLEEVASLAQEWFKEYLR